jgi:hypothetical protein
VTNPVSWIDVFPDVIQAAVERGGGVIIVNNQPKAGLGKMLLKRMFGRNTGVTFRVEGDNPLPQLENSEPTQEPKDGDPCVTATPGT